MATPVADAEADGPTLPEKEVSDVRVTVRFAEEPRGIFNEEDETESENPGDPRRNKTTGPTLDSGLGFLQGLATSFPAAVVLQT